MATEDPFPQVLPTFLNHIHGTNKEENKHQVAELYKMNKEEIEKLGKFKDDVTHKIMEHTK